MSSNTDHRSRTLFLGAILHAFTHVYQVALLPLYFLIRDDLELTGVGQSTSLVTVMMIAYFVPSYFAGILADKFSKKHLLAIGLAINGLGFIGLAESGSYHTALAFVVIAGLGGSLFHPSATSLIARLYPTGTGRALGLLGIGAAVGFLIGPIYAGWRANMLEPMIGPSAWRKPVFELGLAGLIMSAIFQRYAAEDKVAVPADDSTKPVVPMFPTPALWALFLGAAFFFSLRDFTGFGMGSLGSLFLQKAHGFDTKLTGSTLSVIFLAASISTPMFGGLSDRGRIRWTLLVLSVSALLVFIFPHFPAEWAFAPYFVYGFFFMGSYPMVEAALMEAVPDAVRGRVFGVFITIGGGLGSLAPWILGEWVKNLGDPAIGNPSAFYPIYGVLTVTLLLSLIGLPFLHAIRKREHELEKHPSPAVEAVKTT
jgi:MFS transporter, FSR family, fosmidomycin resistance protein